MYVVPREQGEGYLRIVGGVWWGECSQKMSRKRWSLEGEGEGDDLDYLWPKLILET